MKQSGKYTIAFGGLRAGVHEFDFAMDDCFFADFEQSEIKKAVLNVTLELNKKTGMLILDFHILGTVVVQCDLCLEEFDMPTEVRQRLYVKFTEHPGEEEEDIIYMYPLENEINISHYLYEFIHLALPMKRIHPRNEAGESLCNREMLLNIAQFSGKKGQQDKGQWNGLEKALHNNNK